jgi:peptide/nickel transport system substrate-binding protein
MGGQTRIDSSDRDNAHERAIYAPLMRAFINGRGKRVGESALGQILGHPYSAPYEDLTIKQN